MNALRREHADQIQDQIRRVGGVGADRAIHAGMAHSRSRFIVRAQRGYERLRFACSPQRQITQEPMRHGGRIH